MKTKKTLIYILLCFLFTACDEPSASTEEDTDLTEVVQSDDSEATEVQSTESPSEQDENAELTKEVTSKISSDAGYAWETVDNSNDIYTTLLFNGGEFVVASYTMHGSTNPQDFTRDFDFTGKWKMVRKDKAEGIFDESETTVDWTFNDDYTSLINSKGAIFKRVSIN
jgi:hypothetical protein